MLAEFSAAVIVGKVSLNLERRCFCLILNSLLRRPNIFLILGIISIFAATVFTFSGKAWVRFSGWVYRAKEPGWFWWEVALYYLVGVWFVGYFLYKVYGLSN
jgi:hypothetical protein